MATTSPTPPRTKPAPKAVPSKAKAIFKPAFVNAVAVNFRIDAKALRDSIPRGLTLDFHKGDTYVSLVCLQIKKVPLLGMPIIPGFCELSLRCFVSQKNDPTKLGTYYLKSYSSSKLGSWALKNLIGHQHQQLGIKAHHRNFDASAGHPSLDFHWMVEGHENRMRIRGRDEIKKQSPDSKLGFIMAHSNRYLCNAGKTLGYAVTRPPWQLWDAGQANFTCDVRRLFGKQYVKPLAARPSSVFLSPGSKVTIHRPFEL